MGMVAKRYPLCAYATGEGSHKCHSYVWCPLGLAKGDEALACPCRHNADEGSYVMVECAYHRAMRNVAIGTPKGEEAAV